MTTAYTTLLGLALPVQGELTGTWGNTVNTAVTQLCEDAVAGVAILSTDADVTLTTTTGATNQARMAILSNTGARTAQRTITAPAASKAYIVINATSGGFAVKLVGAGPTTGVTIPNGQQAVVAWNGTDFVIVAMMGVTSIAMTVPSAFSIAGSPITTNGTIAITYSGTAVPVTSGGTGNITNTLNSLMVGAGTGAVTFIAPGTSGNLLTSNGTTWASASPASLNVANFPNKVINGDLLVDQGVGSGTVAVNTTGTFYSTDMWYGSGVVSRGVIGLQRRADGPLYSPSIIPM